MYEVAATMLAVPVTPVTVRTWLPLFQARLAESAIAEAPVVYGMRPAVRPERDEPASAVQTRVPDETEVDCSKILLVAL